MTERWKGPEPHRCDIHDTIMQRIISLGMAADFLRRRCQMVCDHKVCHDVIDESDKFLERIRETSRWKKWLLNRLL